MKGFYTVNTPDNPIAATLTNTRKAEYEIFLTHRPPIDADFDDAVTTLASLSGRSPYAVKAIIFALYRLDELPQLKALHEHLFHLDFPRLAAIDQVLDKLGPDPHPDTLERIDTALTRYLTPRTPHRILPSVANLRRKVNALVTAEDPDITPEKKTPPPPEYGVIPLPRGRCQIYAEFDTPDAILIDTTIEATAKHHSISTAEAFKLLITQNATPPRTTLHLYRAADIPDTPVYIPGFGWVDPTTGDTLAQRAQRTT
ncbi:HNH endonuclease, partial [Corynebacterium sp. LK2510]